MAREAVARVLASGNLMVDNTTGRHEPAGTKPCRKNERHSKRRGRGHRSLQMPLSREPTSASSAPKPLHGVCARAGLNRSEDRTRPTPFGPASRRTRWAPAGKFGADAHAQTIAPRLSVGSAIMIPKIDHRGSAADCAMMKLLFTFLTKSVFRAEPMVEVPPVWAALLQPNLVAAFAYCDFSDQIIEIVWNRADHRIESFSHRSPRRGELGLPTSEEI